MRARSTALLMMLLGCSSPTIGATPPTDAAGVEAATDAPSVDAPSDRPTAVDAPSDRPAMDIPPMDVPVTDVPAVDIPAVDASCSGSTPHRCAGACVNLLTDRFNCGSCQSVCAGNSLCNAGVCVADDCPGGRFCSGTCRRTDTDNLHCGACDQRCCAGNICLSGTCITGCTPGTTSCPGTASSCRGGVCVNTVVDPANCGGCGNRCAAGETCVAGACRGGGFMALTPCNTAGNYTTASTVRFGGAVGSAYVPPCVTVRAGGSVTWEGGFDGHPLAPSSRGTGPNPIARVSTGTSATVRFPSAGFYPFYCEFHGTSGGSGMAGVVQVVE